jgi:uncharacterized protein YndB with AHSA1/START domain
MTTNTTSNRTTIRLSESRHLDRPAADVWAVIADYGRDPEWRHAVTTMAPSAPGLVEVGMTTNEDISFGGRRYHNEGRVVSVEDGLAFSWETTSGTDARGSRSVEPLTATSSRVVLTLEVEPTGAERLLALVVRRMLAAQLRGDADRLVGLLTEGGDARRASAG